MKRKSHVCTECGYRDGDQCKFSDFLEGPTPRHITWWTIDWSNEDFRCPVHQWDDDEDEDEDA